MINNNFDSNKLTDDEIDFGEIFNILLLQKWFILSVTTLFAVCSVIYSINLPNIYQSKSLLSPTDQNNGVSQAMKSYGGIASIAGIDLSQSSGGKTAQAMRED